jgi:hypothetical protein
MLTSKLLGAKKLFSTITGESIVDLISATFKYASSPISSGTIFVNEFEVMRPDLIAERVYSNSDSWDIVLKYNGISNPFSINFGEVILAPAFTSISTLIRPPREVVEKGTEPAKKNESKIIVPKTQKDKKRLESIRTSVPEIVPPNVNLTGAKNVQVVNGEVIFGANMTQASSTNLNQSAVRNRVKDQLKNNDNLNGI